MLSLPHDGLQRHDQSAACQRRAPAGLHSLSHDDELDQRDVQSYDHRFRAHRGAHHAAMRAVPRQQQLRTHLGRLLSLPHRGLYGNHQSTPCERRAPAGLHPLPYDDQLDQRDVQSCEHGFPTHRGAHTTAMRAMPRQQQLQSDLRGLLSLPHDGLQRHRQSTPR
jgi:hypothetical protein